MHELSTALVQVLLVADLHETSKLWAYGATVKRITIFLLELAFVE